MAMPNAARRHSPPTPPHRGCGAPSCVRCRALLVAVPALVAAAAGCAKAKAASAADGPPLAMPAPPPRVLAPVEEPLESRAGGARSAGRRRRRAPARPPCGDRRGRAAAAGAEAASRRRSIPRRSRPRRRPRETARRRRPPTDAAAERKVRDALARAARDLSRVDYGRLSADGRAQYEQSKRFTEQAEQALKDRNYVFATTLADKAASSPPSSRRARRANGTGARRAQNVTPGRSGRGRSRVPARPRPHR